MGETLEKRVEELEKTVNSLQSLPAAVKDLTLRTGRVELQIVQLRTDMNDGFSAIRGEMGETKSELREDIAALGRETAAGFLRAGVEMRALFEEHLGRRAVIAEGNPTPDEPPSTP